MKYKSNKITATNHYTVNKIIEPKAYLSITRIPKGLLVPEYIPSGQCVYFLLGTKNGMEFVYVGESHNFQLRKRGHLEKKWNLKEVIIIQKDNMTEAEARFCEGRILKLIQGYCPIKTETKKAESKHTLPEEEQFELELFLLHALQVLFDNGYPIISNAKELSETLTNSCNLYNFVLQNKFGKTKFEKKRGFDEVLKALCPNIRNFTLIQQENYGNGMFEKAEIIPELYMKAAADGLQEGLEKYDIFSVEGVPKAKQVGKIKKYLMYYVRHSIQECIARNNGINDHYKRLWFGITKCGLTLASSNQEIINAYNACYKTPISEKQLNNLRELVTRNNDEIV